MVPCQSIREDLFRYEGRWSWLLFFRYFFFVPGFRYSCILRWTQRAGRLSKFLWMLCLRRYQVLYGIQIPHSVSIGRGFRIAHFGAIVVNPAARIGHNFNIAQGAVIGNAPAGKHHAGGAPVIGDDVCVQANAVIVGGVRIGNRCIIAPGAFVNRDMPDDTIALGNPAVFHYRENASAALIVYRVQV